LNRLDPRDLFVAEQVFTLMEPVTITAKTWHFGKVGLISGSRPPLARRDNRAALDSGLLVQAGATQRAWQLTGAPVDRLLTSG
jgi:hypothetical protein